MTQEAIQSETAVQIPSREFVSQFTGIDLYQIAEIQVLEGNVLEVTTRDGFDEFLSDFHLDTVKIWDEDGVIITFEWMAGWSNFESGKSFYEAMMHHYGTGEPIE